MATNKNDTPAPAPDVTLPAKPQEAAPALPTIEALRKKHKVSAAIFAGACAAAGWSPGKQLPEAEFIKTIKSFTDAPMSRVGRKEGKAHA